VRRRARIRLKTTRPGDCPFCQVVLGTPRSDTIKGTASGNRMWGMGGADFIDGGAGDDLLDGGAGNDRLRIQRSISQGQMACPAHQFVSEGSK